MSVSETTALAKHSCPACGAQAVWDPRRRALVCSYCGTVAPGDLKTDSGQIVEHDLVTSLRELPDNQRGWRTATRTVKCQSCKAVTVFDASRVGQRCDFCGSSALVDYEEIRAPVKPESLLPFKVDRERFHAIIKAWLGGRWFAPNALKRRSLVDTVVGVYIPFWTFDSEVHCPWEAQSGYYYYTNETYTDANGNRRTRRVRHTRWEPSSGAIHHSFDDVLIAGTHVVNPRLLPHIQDFPTKQLVPYDTGYLSGWIVEHYQVVLLEAAEAAREAKNRILRQLCAREVPGDTHRHLRIHPQYSQQTFKHILVPVWILNYDYGRKRFQVLINGYSGTIAGDYPKSFWKIFFLALVVAVIVGIFFYLSKS